MRKHVRAIVGAAVFCGCPVAVGGVNTWTPIGPEGGPVTRVIHHPAQPSTLYALAPSGVYRSNDSGLTWLTLKNDFSEPPSDLEVSPTNPDVAYVAAPGTVPVIIRSASGSVHADPMSYPDTAGQTLQLEVSGDGNTLYAATDERVYVSTDGGLTWQARASVDTSPSPTTTVVVMAIDPNDPATLYALALVNGPGPQTLILLGSRDGAASWQLLRWSNVGEMLHVEVPANAPAGRVWLVGGFGGAGISVSGDYGVTWTQRHTICATQIAAAPQQAGVLYATGCQTFVLKTIDDGATWSSAFSIPQAFNNLHNVSIHPADASKLLVSGTHGIVATEDGGATWALRNTGLNSLKVRQLVPDRVSDRIYAHLDLNGIYSFAGGGTAAQSVNNAGLAVLQGSPQSLNVGVIHAQPGSPGRLFASVGARVARSGDSGLSWDLSSIGTIDDVVVVESSEADPQILIASSFEGTYRSTDGGDHWAQVQGMPAGTHVTQLQFAPSNGAIAYAVMRATLARRLIFRSADAGQTWQEIGPVPQANVLDFTVHPADPQTVYAVLADPVRMVRTIDGGATWSPFATPALSSRAYLAIDRSRVDTLYLTTGNAVHRSVDGGSTWRDLGAPTPGQTATPILTIDPRRPSTLLVGTQSHGVRHLSIEPDLEVAVTAPASITRGTAVSHTITIENDGDFHATGVRVTMTLPGGATGISANGNSCQTAGTTVTCTWSVLAARSGASFILTATPATEGNFNVSISVQGDQPDSVTNNNSRTSTVSVTAPPTTPTNPPGGTSGGGGGGGGAFSMLLLLAGLVFRVHLTLAARGPSVGPSSQERRIAS